jgi:hypothetical protein
MKTVLIVGLVLTVLEWMLLSSWGFTTIWVCIDRFNDHASEYVLEHRSVAFHFIGMVALLLVMEKYKTLMKIRHEKKTSVWDDALPSVGYYASWGAAILSTLVTDVCSFSLLWWNDHTGTNLWTWETVVAIWGLIDTSLIILWSVWLCVAFASASGSGLSRRIKEEEDMPPIYRKKQRGPTNEYQ